MKKTIYLINRQDKYCPENNNGDYIVEAWLTRFEAEQAAKDLDEIEPSWYHIVQEIEVGPSFRKEKG